MKNIILSLVLIGTIYADNAERGEYFYEFNDNNKTIKKNNTNPTTISKQDNTKLLEELLKVAKEQRDIQKDIYELIKEEIHPTPRKVIINGVECIENSSADCFVMPLTRDAQKIPVLKALLTNPNIDTAKTWLKWYAKYMTSGPFKVGRSFQYALNTYGEEAYPMNITRGDVNTNTDELKSLRDKHRQTLLNSKYKNDTLGLYIFLDNGALDFLSINQIGDIANNIFPKTKLTLIFKTTEKLNAFKIATKTTPDLKHNYKSVKMIIHPESFKQNNIYMTPSYLAVSKEKKKGKKQVIANGRVSRVALNHKIYEWLEQENIIKRGALSDYKLWNTKANNE